MTVLRWAALVLAFVTAGGVGADGAGQARLQAEIEAARTGLYEAELQIEALKRHVPAEPETAAVDAYVKRAAAEAEMPAPDVVHEQGVAGPPGVTLYGVRLSGRARYGRVNYFLSILSFCPRPMDLRELELAAAPGGTVAWRAGFVLPTFSGVPLPAPKPAPPIAPGLTPEQARDAAMEAMLRRQLDDVLARREALRSSLQALLRLSERRTSRVSHALGLFADGLHSSALALTRVRAGSEAVLEGVVIGEGTRGTLREAAGKAGLQVTDLRFTPSGRCHAFVLTARWPAQEPRFESVSSNGLFDDAAQERCAAAPAPPPAPCLQAVVARGDSGPLTLRLAGAEVAEVVRALHQATSEGFVVDPDVRGRRLDVELAGASLDDAVNALAACGLRVGPAPLRRVSLVSTTVAQPKRSFSGDPITLDIKRGHVMDLMRLFEEVASSPIMVLDGGMDLEVALFAKEMAWDRIFDGIVTAAGLTWTYENAKVYVGPAAMIAATDRSRFVQVSDPDRHLRREWWKAGGP